MTDDAAQRHAIAQLHANIANLARVPRVLIVDDNDIDANLLRSGLMDGRNLQVVVARDGIEALSFLRGDKFDLVFLDLLFPVGMNGLEILDKIKELSAVPVLVLTGVSNHAPMIAKALRGGAAAILQKPLQREQIELIFGTP